MANTDSMSLHKSKLFQWWNKHVDLEKTGDRKASCGAEMKPIGLKQTEIDKSSKPRQGELIVVVVFSIEIRHSRVKYGCAE